MFFQKRRTLIARSAVRFVLLCFTVGLAACQGQAAGKPPTPMSTYAMTLAAADKRVEAGDYAGADRILADFALKSRGTSEATEIAFWRAVYMVDPANRTASIAEGIRALEIYLASPGAHQYRPQAQVLRRTAQSFQALRQAQAAPRVVGRDTVFVTREEEIAELRDQLARANAELERIKKRLGNPGR